jgi:hypothetical protein
MALAKPAAKPPTHILDHTVGHTLGVCLGFSPGETLDNTLGHANGSSAISKVLSRGDDKFNFFHKLIIIHTHGANQTSHSPPPALYFRCRACQGPASLATGQTGNFLVASFGGILSATALFPPVDRGLDAAPGLGGPLQTSLGLKIFADGDKKLDVLSPAVFSLSKSR